MRWSTENPFLYPWPDFLGEGCANQRAQYPRTPRPPLLDVGLGGQRDFGEINVFITVASCRGLGTGHCCCSWATVIEGHFLAV